MKESLFFFETFALLFFQTLRGKDLQYFCRHGYGKLVRKSLYMFRRRFLQIKFSGRLINFSSIPEIQQKFFRVLTRKFRQGCQNCIIHVHRNIFRKVVFLSSSSKFFFVVFGIWAENLWILREDFLLPLSKLHTPLLKNRFWWKKNFVQKTVNSISSKFGRVFLIVANEVTTGLSKLRCFCSNDHFNKKVF